MRSNWVKIFELFFALGISIGFLYLFYKVVGFDKLIRFFTEISIINIIFALSLYTLSYVTRTIRWQITLRIKDFWKLFKITSFNTVFNIFLPFRTGELSFFYMLKKENIPISQTTLSFFSVRIFDGIALITVFLVSYLIYTGFFLLSILVFVFMPFSFYLFKFVLSFIKKDKVKDFQESILTLKNIFSLYFLSLFTFVLKFTGFYLVLPKSINLSFIEAFIASSAGDLTTILPIHGVAGIGTYEGGYAGVLILMGVDKESALIASVFVHIFILVGSALLGLFSFLFLRR
ncbi:MAG: flippase-like domain-containing protein [Aquificae bacterium]|nr:flippase-like domain-containing protein [Aquificota bacterium]